MFRKCLKQQMESKKLKIEHLGTKFHSFEIKYISSENIIEIEKIFTGQIGCLD